jgi:hypothetical protein
MVSISIQLVVSSGFGNQHGADHGIGKDIIGVRPTTILEGSRSIGCDQFGDIFIVATIGR